MGKSNKTGKTLVYMVVGLNEGDRLPCVCHTVELSVKKGFDIPEISCVLKKVGKSLTPPDSRVYGGISMSRFLTRNK